MAWSSTVVTLDYTPDNYHVPYVSNIFVYGHVECLPCEMMVKVFEVNKIIVYLRE